MGATASDLTLPECMTLLTSRRLGRLAVVDDGCPVVFPVSYLITKMDGTPVIAFRTRPGNSLDHVGTMAGFQIDEFDPARDGGWSVLVRGTLQRVEPDARFDSRPIVEEERDAWRVLVPRTITGRRVSADPDRWPFWPEAYL